MITKVILPALAVILLTGCVSTAEQEAKEQNNKRLINALRYPGASRLKYTLDRGGDPNVRDQYGVPALIRAVAAQKMDHVELLLKHGADINALDPDGENALFAAVSTGNVELVELLVKKGASLDVRGKNGKTPAMEAVRLGHARMLKYLLDKGADINAVDNDTAGLDAYAATAENGVNLLLYLEARGIKINVNNTNLMGSPFLRALFYDRVKTALFLLPEMKDFNENEEMKQIGKLAVYYAISHNRIDLLKALINKKLELNYNEPFFYKFVKQININGIYKLAARNDIIDKRYTPLMYACIFSRPEMVKLLIESGADPLIENNEGQIAQNYARDRATMDMIKRMTKSRQEQYLKKKTSNNLIIEQDPDVKRATIFGR